MSVLNSVVPDIDLNLQHRDVKLISGSAVNVRAWTSTSFSNVSATFSTPPPSTSIFISRCIMLNLPFSAVLAGTGPLQGTTTLISRGAFALRAYPIDSVLVSLMVTINNMSFALQNSEIVPYISRFWETKHNQSFPSYPDQYANYADGLGASNNPLGSYFDNVYPDNMLRGSYPMIITNLSATGATVSGNIVGPVYLPIFHNSDNDTLGFTNIKTMDFVFNWSSNLSRLFSSALGNLLTGCTVTLGQPTLYQRYTSPPMGYVPRTLVYGSHDINRFITPCPQQNMAMTVTAGAVNKATQTFVSTNIQLNCIPAYLIAFVRESNANLTISSADTVMNISNVSINFANISGILSSASENDLWKMSHSNGLQTTFAQWQGVSPTLSPQGALPSGSGQISTVGSFLKLVFGKDIMLNTSAGDYVGKVGPFNLSMTVTCNAINTTPVVSPQLYIITVSPQKIIIHEDGLIQSVLGVADEQGQYVPYNDVASEFFGAGFSDWVAKVMKFLSPVNKFLKDTKLISTVGQALAPVPYVGQVASQIGQVAQRMGYGEGGLVMGGDGGRVASREELLERIKRLS